MKFTSYPAEHKVIEIIIIVFKTYVWWGCATWSKSLIPVEVISYADNNTYRLTKSLFLNCVNLVDVLRRKLQQHLWCPFIFVIVCHLVCRRQKHFAVSEIGVCFEHSTVRLWLSSIDSLCTVWLKQFSGTFESVVWTVLHHNLKGTNKTTSKRQIETSAIF